MAFSDSGGITPTILTTIFKRLDNLGIYEEERKEGKKPFVLLDGHQSRFDLEFLDYINDPKHLWTVCIGVPYGTAYWQVGDSSEQNGSFKMNLSAWKQKTLSRRMTQMQSNLGIQATDIIPMVRYAWEKSFARKDTNAKAIAERGWFPLNRNCLLNSEIRVSMTEEELDQEKERGLSPFFEGNNNNNNNTNNNLFRLVGRDGEGGMTMN